MKKKNLKQKYEKKTIAQIEKSIKLNFEKSMGLKLEAMLGLYFLKTSKRYKENPLYKKSSFKVYLESVYNMREGTFDDSIRAALRFPDEATKYGIGLVAKVFRDCGFKKEKIVFKEIAIKAKQLKTPIKRGQIDTIIKKYAKPLPPAKPAYKELYVTEKAAHDNLIAQYNDLMTAYKSAQEQIKFLKKSIAKCHSLLGEDAA